jgi:hypothetical protein
MPVSIIATTTAVTCTHETRPRRPRPLDGMSSSGHHRPTTPVHPLEHTRQHPSRLTNSVSS